MKHIIVFLLIIFLALPSAAQDKEIQTADDAVIKKGLLLSSMQVNTQPGYSVKERLMLITSEDKAKYDRQQLESSAAQAEDFKLSTGLLYFAGAAAVAAIIYFLVPDNEPSSEKKLTFGLPVTPK